MRAALLEAPQGPQPVTEIDLDEPHVGEVLVDVAHCGVCHSDLSVQDGSFPSPMPVVLGHEAAGVIAAVGDGVTSSAPGDRVVLVPLPSCGSCYFCTRRQPTLCATYSPSLITGTMTDGTSRLSRGGAVVHRGLATGAFAERTVLPERAAVKVADDVPLETACVIGCALLTGVGAVLNTAAVEEGATVLVLGAGGIGLAVTQGARVAGATTIVVSDPSADRREAALGFGATHVVDPTADDPVALTTGLTGVGVDYAFEAAGLAALIEQGIAATRPGGTTVCVGAPPLEQGISIPNVVTFTATEKRLVGCLLGSVNAHRDIPRIVDLWRAGRLDLESMITGRRPLEQLDAAFTDARNGTGIRTVIDI